MTRTLTLPLFATMNLQSQNAVGQAGLLIGRDNIIRLDASEEHARIAMDDVRTAKALLPDHAKEILKNHDEKIKEYFLYSKVEPYEKQNV